MASTTQYNWMPKMYCHTNTDNPKDAPKDSTTVPTMTSAATRLLVMKIMISRIRLSADSPAIIRSYVAPSECPCRSPRCRRCRPWRRPTGWP